MALRPPAETNGGLDPVASAFLAPWMEFGAPAVVVSNGFALAVEDRRAALYVPRQAWLDRNVRPYGLDASAWEIVWRSLDEYVVTAANEQVAKAAKNA